MGQIIPTLPHHLMTCTIVPKWLAILAFKLGKNLAIMPANFNSQFSITGIGIYEEVLTVEDDFTCSESPTLSPGIHRSETIASQCRKSRAPACVHMLAETWRYPRESPEVKAQFVTNN